MFDSNPEMKELLNNQDALKDMMNPDNMQKAMEMMGGMGMGMPGMNPYMNPYMMMSGAGPTGGMPMPGMPMSMPEGMPIDYGEEDDEVSPGARTEIDKEIAEVAKVEELKIKFAEQLKELKEMGYGDTHDDKTLVVLLEKNKGDIPLSIE